jgi:hypothetical protein
MQPHDVPVALFELRTIVMVVRDELMRLEVCVRNSVRVVGVRFVQVRSGKRPRQGDDRHQKKYDHEPAESVEHASELWFVNAKASNAAFKCPQRTESFT